MHVKKFLDFKISLKGTYYDTLGITGSQGCVSRMYIKSNINLKSPARRISKSHFKALRHILSY